MRKIIFLLALFLATPVHSQEGMWEDSLPLDSLGGTDTGPVPDCGPGDDLQDGDGDCISVLTDGSDADALHTHGDFGDYVPAAGGTFSGGVAFEGDLFIPDLVAGDLACGTGTEGQIAVNDDDPMQWCDSQTPPVRRNAAYGNDLSEAIAVATGGIEEIYDFEGSMRVGNGQKIITTNETEVTAGGECAEWDATNGLVGTDYACGAGNRACQRSITTEEQGDILMCGKAYANLDLLSISCVALGGDIPSPGQTVEIFECDGEGANCLGTGFAITATALEVNYGDTSGTDEVIGVLNWWGLKYVTKGTAQADYLHCQVRYFDTLIGE